MKLLEFFGGAGSVGKSECDFVFEQSQGLILVKSECDFCGVVLGGGGEVPVKISIQCLNTWYSTAEFGVFHCGIWGIPVRDMGYSTAGYGVFHWGIWDIQLVGDDIEYIELEDI